MSTCGSYPSTHAHTRTHTHTLSGLLLWLQLREGKCVRYKREGRVCQGDAQTHEQRINMNTRLPAPSVWDTTEWAVEWMNGSGRASRSSSFFWMTVASKLIKNMGAVICCHYPLFSKKLEAAETLNSVDLWKTCAILEGRHSALTKKNLSMKHMFCTLLGLPFARICHLCGPYGAQILLGKIHKLWTCLIQYVKHKAVLTKWFILRADGGASDWY